MTCVIHPLFLAKHGKTVVTSRNRSELRKELSHVVTTATHATASLWSLLLDPILVVTEEAHPQEDVPCIFIGLLHPSLNGTDNVIQGICPAP